MKQLEEKKVQIEQKKKENIDFREELEIAQNEIDEVIKEKHKKLTNVLDGM